MSYIQIGMRLRIASTEELIPADVNPPEFNDEFQTGIGDIWHEALAVPAAPSDFTFNLNGAPQDAKAVLVHNYDSTNFVTVSFKDLAGQACSVKVPAGRTLLVPGCKNNQDVILVADTATCVCDMWVGFA